MTLRTRLGLLLLLIPANLLGPACAPLTIESGGARIFNPTYRGFLTWAPRDIWQRPDEVVEALEIKPGQVVADVGAGNGYFVDRLSAQVGAHGRVYATDVQEIMLRDLRTRVEENGLSNVRVVHGAFDDPSLPAACCDLIFFANVYKEIQDRVAYMQRVRNALRSEGRVAILGFRADVRGPGPPASVRLDPERVVEELTRAGFDLRDRHQFLPRQYFLVFEPRRSEPQEPGAAPGG